MTKTESSTDPFCKNCKYAQVNWLDAWGDYECMLILPPWTLEPRDKGVRAFDTCSFHVYKEGKPHV